MLTGLAIIADNNKILIGRLKKEKLEKYGGIQYVFPSAQTERPEDIQNKVIREVKTQANLDIIATNKIGERIHPITQNLTYYYLCNVKESRISVSPKADIEEFMWVTKKEISEYMPFLFEKIKEYLQIT